MKDMGSTPNENDVDNPSILSSKNFEVIVGNARKKSFFKNKKVAGIGLLVVCLLGLSYVGFLNFYKTPGKQGFKAIAIGDTIATKADVDRYASSIEDPTSPINPGPFPAIYYPYFRVYGNDVMVGSFFRDDSNECPAFPHSGPTVQGWTRTVTEPLGHGLRNQLKAGASAQFAVFKSARESTGTPVFNPNYPDEAVPRFYDWKVGFFSDNQRPIMPPNINHTEGENNLGMPNRLTFGNSYNLGGAGGYTRDYSWGGLSGIDVCIPNYFKDAKDSGATISPGGKLSDIAPTLVAPVENGTRKLLVVEGDLFINHNIEYKNTNNWGSESDIPNVTIVVKGNIRIDKDVTRLDGIYVAQPKIQNTQYYDITIRPERGGIIYTCSKEDGPDSNPELPETCQKQLVINGSVMSNVIYLKRTNGSTTCPGPVPSPIHCSEADPYETADSDNTAEVFNFSPEAYLTPLSSKLETSAPYQKYDSITSLPPVL